jgi:hypothetical protein
MNLKLVSLAVALSATTLSAQAGDVYAGIGFPGLTLGYSHTLSPSVKVRGEYAGGLSMSKNGQSGGVNYDAKVKTNRLGAFADWYPGSSGFHLTGGLTFSDISGDFKSRGGLSTIGGKPVDLTGRTFDVTLKFPDVTPYAGIGWSSHPASAKGWSVRAELGFQIGKFNTTVRQNVVGVGGITQDDVDAEVKKVRDAVTKLSVLPSVSLGANYRF